MQIMPFVSWDLIHTGACQWTEEGRCVSCDHPHGVELRVEPAGKSGPILEADRPWEQGADPGWVQVMEDEGRYRMWYGIGTEGEPDAICYAESEDGLAWTKPELGLFEVGGSSANNVVWQGRGAVHFSVFKDPTAPPEARYRCWTFKGWFEGEPDQELDGEEGMRRLKAQNASEPSEDALPVKLRGTMYGMNSPDGLRWTAIKEPILEGWHDTHDICTYDEGREKYVGYFRGFYAGRRAIAYAETDDFEHWPAPEVIHHQLIQDPPGDSLYSNCYTRYPDVPGVHLMFPAVYHQDDDSVDGQLAVSMDGRNWTRHTHRAIVERGLPEERDAARVYPEPALLRFRSDGKFRLPLRCSPRFHDQGPGSELAAGGGYVGWAEWEEDRLAGIHAASEGAFMVTRPLELGERMLANFRTSHDGWVRFELTDRIAWPTEPWPGLEGYRFEDMVPLTGDRTHCPIAWGERPTCQS